MIYVQLFLSFLQVGMFSVGGGYAAIPLIQSQVVEQHGWLTMQEFTDLVTIAEMTPGPIAVNAATFVGLRIAQVSGAIVATLGCITPALFFVSLLSYIYRRYKDISLLQSVLACLRPVIVALIFGAGFPSCRWWRLAAMQRPSPIWTGSASAVLPRLFLRCGSSNGTPS